MKSSSQLRTLLSSARPLTSPHSLTLGPTPPLLRRTFIPSPIRSLIGRPTPLTGRLISSSSSSPIRTQSLTSGPTPLIGRLISSSSSSHVRSPSLTGGPTKPPCRTSFLRTLIVERLTISSPVVNIHRLSDSDSGILEVKLERPEARNAISKEMLKGLQNAIALINEDVSVNVVLLSSSVPRVFCAGADLKERRLMNANEVRDFVNSLRSTFSSFEEIKVPTIGIIEGAALGGGLELALSCDIRVSGENAIFSLPETGLGIIPGAGGTQKLPRIVGKSIAKDLIFTGRKITSTEALSIGLVNYCVPSGDAYQKALQLAREMNQKGPLALKMAKKAINEGMEVDSSNAVKIEENCYEITLNTKDRLEGLNAFVEKRKPVYTGK